MIQQMTLSDVRMQAGSIAPAQQSKPTLSVPLVSAENCAAAVVGSVPPPETLGRLHVEKSLPEYPKPQTEP